MMPPQPTQARPPMPGAAAGAAAQQPAMPSAPAQPPMASAPIPTGNMSMAQKYQVAAGKFLPAVSERNPHLKDQVGHTIYDYVQHLSGPEKAPKITGMLIELPVEQIKQFMSSYDALQLKVNEANTLLMQQEM